MCQNLRVYHMRLMGFRLIQRAVRRATKALDKILLIFLAMILELFLRLLRLDLVFQVLYDLIQHYHYWIGHPMSIIIRYSCFL